MAFEFAGRILFWYSENENFLVFPLTYRGLMFPELRQAQQQGGRRKGKGCSGDGKLGPA